MDFFPLLYNQHSPSSSTPSLTSDLALRRQVEAKLADGDVTGAVRLASSNDTLAPFDGETLSGLWSKHPPSPLDLKFPEQPDDSSEILPVLCAVVDHAIHGFRAGFAGGLDRLRPQHFKELISKSTGEAGVCFLKSLTLLVNHVVWRVPPYFSSFLFWG